MSHVSHSRILTWLERDERYHVQKQHMVLNIAF